ncbi:MAG: hypothetical protein F6K62_11420 [Sphaerospermopsis sp. SIO1G2]|nr:hypothetical protein [Sphaerospermopsis sp. SIO1G2]
MTYYIVDGESRTGPYDLLGIILKIRSDSIEKTQLVEDGEGDPRPLYEHEMFRDVFDEQQAMHQEMAQYEEKNISFLGAFKAGVSVLQCDTTSIVITACTMLIMATIVGGLIVALPANIAALVAPYLAYLSFSFYLIIMLPLSRVQRLSFHAITRSLKGQEGALLATPVLPSFFVFSVPWLLSTYIGYAAWGLLLFPGLPILIYLLYIPLIIADREHDLAPSLRENHRIFMEHGGAFIRVNALLILVNIVACALIFAPFITLPITILGMLDIYDKHFYSS